MRAGRRFVTYVLAAAACWVGSADADPPVDGDFRLPPLSLREAQSKFHVQNGFRIDLLAAEPLVTDPVAMVYDEDGRAFVAEMNDYPYTDPSTDRPFVEKNADEPLGRIRMLTDDDGDGRFDKSVVFADRLSWPTGLALWKGGLFVAATPDVWYLKDADGDGKADIRRKVLTGFRKFNIQAVMNNPRWGIDHKIYFAGGTNGGQIVRPDQKDAAPLALSVGDFVFDPVTETFSLESGGARFGQTMDDWGRRFLCNIRNPVQHVVLSSRYLSRNPFAGIKSALHDAADSGEAIPVFRASDPEPWRVENARRLAGDPAGFSPRSETLAAGYMTSACGITIYRGSAFSPEFYGNVFLAEPSANLVHRQVLSPHGTTFRSVRADPDTEFLTSTDHWFRPVNFVNAPDGTLHMLDMSRETIEHPWSIPDDIKARLDLRSGRDRGRIYRIAPAAFDLPTPPRLGRASIPELVDHLSNPNSWWRDTAHRLIFERQDAAAVPFLRKLLQSRPSRAGLPDFPGMGRFHALWSLVGLDALTDEDLIVALTDPSAGVRENAIRIAEDRLAASRELQAAIANLADDPDPRVRFQVILSLGAIAAGVADHARATVAFRNAGDSLIRAAILCSTPPPLAALLHDMFVKPDLFGDNSHSQLVREIALSLGSENNDTRVRAVIADATAGSEPESLSSVALAGLAEGLARRGQRLIDKLTPGSAEMARLEQILGRASVVARDDAASLDSRVQAIGLLASGGPRNLSGQFRYWLASRQPAEIQAAAIRAIVAARTRDGAEMLAAAYPSLGPGARALAVESLLSKPEWCQLLVEAIERGMVKPWEVPRSRRAPLMRHPDPKVRYRAKALFAKDSLGPRNEVLERYRAVLAMPSDPTRGRDVFRKSCQGCHRRGTDGRNVGPSLDTVRNRSKDELLLAIFDPNREVAPEFMEYAALLVDGRVTGGVIASQTDKSVTLRRAEGIEETLLRDQIDELTGSGRSLMPEGLEQQIDLQQAADLLAFLLEKN